MPVRRQTPQHGKHWASASGALHWGQQHGPSVTYGEGRHVGRNLGKANIKVHPTGEVSVIIGSKPHGQAHETTFAQIVAEVLGIDISQIEILHSDTDRAPFGQGSYGSRSFSVGARQPLRRARRFEIR